MLHFIMIDSANYSSMNNKTILIIPVYNEQKRLDLKSFESFLALDNNYLLFVDDNSDDDTFKVIDSWSTSFPKAQILTLPLNVGKSNAIWAGWNHAEHRGFEFIGYFDADLSTPLSQNEKFQKKLMEETELIGVFGSRQQTKTTAIQRSFFRHLWGRLFNLIVTFKYGIKMYDTQCGAKLFRNCEIMKTVFSERFKSRWLIDIEILLRLKKQDINTKFLISEIPLDSWTHVIDSKLKKKDMIKSVISLFKLEN